MLAFLRTLLRENWPWIVGPVVIVFLLLAWILLTTEGGDGAAFTYTIF